MDRVYDKLFSQIYHGVNCYQTNNLVNFEEKKDIIKHGRNGIFTNVFGGYRLISDPKKVCSKIHEEIDGYSGIVTQSEIDIYDLGFAKVQKFPYNNSGLEVKISYTTLDDFESFINLGFTDIRNLMLTYKKQTNLIKIVGVNQNNNTRRRKIHFEKQLKPSFTY